MEELTIEQKAKAYDEAIKRIENIKTGKCETTFMFTEGLFEHIFPELKEDRDERIRKALISYFKIFKEQEDCGLLSKKFYGIPTDDIRAWLEKQGEQKPNPYSGTSFEYNGHTWGMCARDNGVEILIDSEIKAFISPEKSFIYPTPLHHNGTSKARLAIEAIREEAVDNTNKPKFHEGDTIVEKDFFECDYEVIKEIKDGKYIFTDGSTLNIDEQDGWLLVKPPK